MEKRADALLRAWDQHRVVAVGELHRSVQDKEFFLQLTEDERFAGAVNDIAIEFGDALHQPVLDRYVQGERVGSTEVEASLAYAKVVSIMGGAALSGACWTAFEVPPILVVS